METKTDPVRALGKLLFWGYGAGNTHVNGSVYRQVLRKSLRKDQAGEETERDEVGGMLFKIGFLGPT